MSQTTGVVIIGAGPYGLSLAAHLRAAAIPYRIFGKAMDSWKNNMPPGMLLKSRLASSNLYDPSGSLTLERFYRESGIPVDRFAPPTLETFVAYGEAFQARFVPDLEPKVLTKLERTTEGFVAAFDDGDTVVAPKVVCAIGVHPFKYIPDVLRDLPDRVMSHSADHGPLDMFVGKAVAVVGSGSSATDLAALLNESGATATLIARAPSLSFVGPAAQRSMLRRKVKQLLTPLYPSSGIGSGWLLKICADAPWLFHALPEKWRLHIAQNALGPKGHDFMKERVLGKVHVMTGRNLHAAKLDRGKVDLHLAANNGTREVLQVDHVVAATGYRVDIDRLAFVDEALRSAVRTVKGGPVLSSDYESSVAGLYFIGPASLNSFGPVVRFVLGSSHSSRRLTDHFSRTLSGRQSSFPAKASTLGPATAPDTEVRVWQT
jgi:thioredoxin reductase